MIYSFCLTRNFFSGGMFIQFSAECALFSVSNAVCHNVICSHKHFCCGFLPILPIRFPFTSLYMYDYLTADFHKVVHLLGVVFQKAD